MSSSKSEQSLTTSLDRRFTTLLQLMSAEFQGSMVADVLSHRSQLPGAVRKKLTATINKEVSVIGFPNYPDKALPGVLKAEILKALQESDRLASAILRAWLALRSNLRNVVTEHLCNHGLEAEHLDFRKSQLNDFWSAEDWMSERDRILESYDGLDEDDVALMLCCVTSKMPSIAVVPSEEKNQTPEQNILDQALSYLKQLPADSPEWQSVPGFLSAVRDLSEVNATWREEAAAREALAKELSQLSNKYSEQLTYLEIDVHEWSIPVDCNLSVISEALSLICQLSTLVADHDSIPHQGATYAETARLFSQRESVIDRITDVKSLLDKALTTGGWPSDTCGQASTSDLYPTTTIKPQATQASTDVTLSDLLLSSPQMEFDSATLTYEVSLDNDTDVLTMTPAANQSEANVEVFIDSRDDDFSYKIEPTLGSYNVEDIPVGQTRVLVSVSDKNGEASRTFIVVVTRAASSDSRLCSLVPSVERLEFRPDLTEYTVDLPDGMNEISFAFGTVHDGASVALTLEKSDGVTISQVEPANGTFTISGLTEGRSLLRIAVTAEDCITVTEYRVELTTHRLSQCIDHIELMWSLVSRDDIAAAYWLSKSLAADGLAPAYLPQLLKAVQGSRWLSPDSKDFIEDLFAIVSEVSPPFDDEYAMLGLAAALQPSIIAPETNLLAWLATPSFLPILEGIVSPVRHFANWGYELRPEHIRGDEGQRRLDDLIRETSAKGSQWLEDGERRRHKLARATAVLRHLCSDRGILHDLLSPVVGDRRADLATVRSDVEALKQDSYRNEAIAEADRLLLGSSPRTDITGAAKEWLQRRIGEACDVAARWCELVGRANEVHQQARNQWLSSQVAELRGQVESASQSIFDELSTIVSDSNRKALSASALCLVRSVHEMLDYLSIDHDIDPQIRTQLVVTDLQTTVKSGDYKTAGSGSTDQLELALSARLLWAPEVDLDDDSLPANAVMPVDLTKVAEDWFESDTDIEAAVRNRVKSNDFRFFGRLQAAWSISRSDDMAGLYTPDLVAARETLGQHLASVRDDVDQAASDGVIEYEGATWNKFAHALADIIVDEVLNFKHVHDTLDAIQNSVRDERTRRREELIREWHNLDWASAGDTEQETGFVQELTNTFELASRDESLDIRVMEDCVSRMRNYRSGDLHDLVLVMPREPLTTLEEFLTFVDDVGDLHGHIGGNELRDLVRRSTG